jgi:hypothetical protein
MSNYLVTGFDRTNGLTIVSAVLEHEFTLILTFADGTRLFLHDDGQSCCESRYITCDDGLETLVGGVLLNIQARPGPNLIQQDEYRGDHDTMFVEVQGSTGFVTLTTHNQHNGYYGGFDLKIDVYGPGELTPAEQARVTRTSNNPWVTPRRLIDVDSVLLQSGVGGRNRAERRRTLKLNYLNRRKRA